MDTTGKSFRKHLVLMTLLAGLFLGGATKVNAMSAAEQTTFTYLTNTMGLNPAAACGVMSNIKSESGFQSNITGLGGAYGICQWTGPRLSRLRSWCGSRGYNYTTLMGQLHFLQYELRTFYPKVYNYLFTVNNSASGSYYAAYYWCYNFEIPANTYSCSVSRGRQAQSLYWPQIGAKSLYVTVQPGENGLKLTWNAIGKYGYKVKRAVKSNGTYKTIATITDGSKKSYVDTSVKKGYTYYYYLEVLNAKGKASGKSNLTSCKSRPSVSDEACRIKLKNVDYCYTGKAVKPAFSVYYDGAKLKLNKDYTVSYANNVNAGKGRMTIRGKGEYAGDITVKFRIEKAKQKLKIRDQELTAGQSVQPYKQNIQGKVTCVIENKKMVRYQNGKLYAKMPGITAVTIRAAGNQNYASTEESFVVTVLPDKTVMTSAVSSTSGSVRLKWKSQEGITGYEIEYCRGSKITASAERILIEDQEQIAKKISKLKKGKQYSFRIRAFYQMDETVLYGEWSKVSKTTVK